jgi:hypothetical protein
MRRRKLFTLAAGASAVLCIAVCVLWVRSYFPLDGTPSDVHGDDFWFGGNRHELFSVGGEIFYSYWPTGFVHGEMGGWYWHGFGFKKDKLVLMMVAPHWLLAAISGAPAAFGLFRLSRNRRERQAGLCRACGYDLRATPERCPECGAVPGGRG